MKNLQAILNGLEGYLISIQRNAEEAMYELEVGIPKNWVYKPTKRIDYETIHEGDNGSIIKVFGIKDDVVIDDLIDFVEVIIETNKRIQLMQEEFDQRMIETKKQLEHQALEFYERLDEVKETSFKSIDEQLQETKRRKEVKTEKSEIDFTEELEEKLSK